MLFDRKIKYLEYLENGSKVHGAGFVKLEVRNNRCDMQVQVSGMHVTDNFTRQILLVAEHVEKSLGELLLSGGKGSIHLSQLDSRNLADTGISYEQLLGIRIPIAAGKEIYCAIGERSPISLEQIAEPEEQMTEESMGEEVKGEKPWSEEGKPEEDLLKEWVTVEKLPEEHISEEQIPEGPLEEDYNLQNQVKGLADTKWKQLSAIYPHIAPFKDERDYLSVGPGDFVILPDKYYRLANNSFLLHGYHNYKHLILSRMETKGRPIYYIGVPGNFYEREKQVAVLFGFESFECYQEPARAGDYGYYMMRVEL